MTQDFNLGFYHAFHSQPKAPPKGKAASHSYAEGYREGLLQKPMKTFSADGQFLGVISMSKVEPAAHRPLAATHKTKKPDDLPPAVPGERKTTSPIQTITQATRHAKRTKPLRVKTPITEESLATKQAELRELEQSLHLREQELLEREAKLTSQLKEADQRAQHALLHARRQQVMRLRKYRIALEKKFGVYQGED